MALIDTLSITYTPAEKKQFFKLMDRMVSTANNYGEPRPKNSTTARLNDLYWIKQVLTPETYKAEELIKEWMMRNVSSKQVIVEKHERIYQSQINFVA